VNGAEGQQVYGPFANEKWVGEALAPFRGQVVIATWRAMVPPRLVNRDSE
jgi:aryl-alcohol dehydrogenase-like predicted oxidoreductase